MEDWQRRHDQARERDRMALDAYLIEMQRNQDVMLRLLGATPDSFSDVCLMLMLCDT
jgi:hypothetical protein